MKQKAFWPAFFVIIGLSIGISAINLNDPLRERIRDFLIQDRRQILAKAIGDLSGKNELFTILKVKTRDSLSLEIYENDETNAKSEFRGRHILPEKRDGHFTFHGNAINLLLMDVNGDGAFEILTSTYDENLVPRMHVLRFHNDLSAFEELGPEVINL